MRILVVTNLFPPDVVGGYELGCSHIVGALRDHGHEVGVITTVPRTPMFGEDDGIFRRFHMPQGYFVPPELDQLSKMSPRAMDAEGMLISSHNVYALLDVVRRLEPQVVYLWHLVGIGGLGLIGALQYLGIPWVWHLMDSVPAQLCGLGGATVPGLAAEVGRSLNGRYIACSRQLVDEIRRTVSLGGPIRFVPNWVTSTSGPVDRRYFTGGHLRIAYAGALRDYKGVFILAEAARFLLERGYVNFSIDFFGSGDSTALRRLILELGVENQALVRGRRDQKELKALLKDYDLFAFPTWEREPFGFVALEAAGEGCVPLITSSCGCAEWLVDGVHCLKAPRTAEAFGGAIQRVLDGEIMLEPIGRRVAHVVRQDFALPHLYPAIEEELVAAAGDGCTTESKQQDAYRLARAAEALVSLHM